MSNFLANGPRGHVSLYIVNLKGRAFGCSPFFCNRHMNFIEARRSKFTCIFVRISGDRILLVARPNTNTSRPPIRRAINNTTKTVLLIKR